MQVTRSSGLGKRLVGYLCRSTFAEEVSSIIDKEVEALLSTKVSAATYATFRKGTLAKLEEDSQQS
eukprot:748435-Alexandrium_andersonii.AAC.1